MTLGGAFRDESGAGGGGGEAAGAGVAGGADCCEGTGSVKYQTRVYY